MKEARVENLQKINTSLVGLNFTERGFVEFLTQLFVTGGEHLRPSLITYNTTTSRPTFLVDSSVMSTYVTSTIRTLRITASESMTYYDQVLVPGEEGGYRQEDGALHDVPFHSYDLFLPGDVCFSDGLA